MVHDALLILTNGFRAFSIQQLASNNRSGLAAEGIKALGSGDEVLELPPSIDGLHKVQTITKYAAPMTFLVGDHWSKVTYSLAACDSSESGLYIHGMFAEEQDDDR